MEDAMADTLENPFDSIEDAHQYVGLLGEVLDQTQDAIQEDIAMAASGSAASRPLQAGTAETPHVCQSSHSQ
jgi:hypothetical protein